MKHALIQIRQDADAAFAETINRTKKAMRGESTTEPMATFTFSSPAQLFSVITPKRWELIEHLQKIGPSAIRALARSLQRDSHRVHDDVKALLEWGIVETTEDGKICVPFEVINADFALKAVA